MDSRTHPLLESSDDPYWHQVGLFEKVDALISNTQHFPSKPPFSKNLATPAVSPVDQYCQPIADPQVSDSSYPDPNVPHTIKKSANSRKVWKAKRKSARLVLGDGVGLEELCKMSTCALVGRISYKSLNPLPLEEWIKETWFPLLGYSPEVQFLKKGWLCFHCKSPSDASLLLSSHWPFGGSSLMLKRWRLDFNPDTDYFTHRHLWVLLPGLPLHLWNEGALRAIGNSLGNL